MKVQLDIVRNSYCEQVFDDLTMSSSQMCAGDLAGGHDTCQGGKKKLHVLKNVS